jgi:ATP-dependent DNA helicase RecG
MTEEKFKEILDKGETDTVEFKTWINAKSMKEIIALGVSQTPKKYLKDER